MNIFALALRSRRLLMLGLAIWMVACQEGGTATTSPPTSEWKLFLYTSPTPSRTSPPVTPGQSSATLPITPQPSSTPFIHTIVKGDTMGSIALKYGVSLEDLLAANPETDPHFMTIGKTVIIPLKVDGQDPSMLSTLTPVPIGKDTPYCYPTAEGGLWCFWEVTNQQARSLENISAWIGLFSSTGELVDSQVALTPLNLLAPGESLPLIARFTSPAQEGYTIRAELQSALLVSGEGSRYLPAQIEITEQEMAADGRQAKVTGNVMQPAASSPAGTIWVAAVAYGQDGKVVGMRRWEAERPCPGYQPPGTPGATIPPPVELISEPVTTTPSPQAVPVICMPFEVTVFSLGPPIARVKVLVEARP